MKRSGTLKRKSSLNRSRWLQRANKATKDRRKERTAVRFRSRRARTRRTENWKRAYGSLERVLAVKDMPCLVRCCPYPAENAHLENGGMSRKSDAKFVANICKGHHTQRRDSLHALGSVGLFNAVHCSDAYGAAAEIERMYPTEVAA